MNTAKNFGYTPREDEVSVEVDGVEIDVNNVESLKKIFGDNVDVLEVQRALNDIVREQVATSFPQNNTTVESLLQEARLLNIKKKDSNVLANILLCGGVLSVGVGAGYLLAKKISNDKAKAITKGHN